MARKICNIVRIILLAIIIFVAVLLVAPKVLGFESMVVLSGSMEPEIAVGSMVYVKSVDFEDIEVGDVISFKLSDGTMVTHRVAAINPDGTLTTKGDANDTADNSPVKEKQLVGMVKGHLPFVGQLSSFIKSSLGIASLCAVAIVVILLSVLPSLTDKEEKKEEHEEETNKKL